MKRLALLVLLAALVHAFTVLPSPAQELSAEVRTWGGQSWRLTEPSLDVYYTILVKPKDGGAPAASDTAPPPAPGNQPQLFGSAKALGSYLDKGPDPLLGHRQTEFFTVERAGTEIRIPLASVRSVLFTRQPVTRSGLPPHVVGSHLRHAATVMLSDGSQVQGDYVNLGTTVLRGMTAQGRVAIPWDEIEVVRFAR